MVNSSYMALFYSLGALKVLYKTKIKKTLKKNEKVKDYLMPKESCLLCFAFLGKCNCWHTV